VSFKEIIMGILENILEKAKELKIEKIGIIKPEALQGYISKVNEREEKVPLPSDIYNNFRKMANPFFIFPKTRSIIVASFFIGHYRIPAIFKNYIGKHYLTDLRNNPHSPENIKIRLFSNFLTDIGIEEFHDSIHGIIPMRWAAKEAGLGVIRHNNFFYTENGSFQHIYAWLIDKDLEFLETTDLPPCPESCNKCIASCPTKSLNAPYTMKLISCVSFLTAVNKTVINDETLNKDIGSWLYGCDACQDVCPFNKGKWKEKDEFPELDNLAENIGLKKILSMDLEEIERKLSHKLFYIKNDDLYLWKINALNVIGNLRIRDLARAVTLALSDPNSLIQEKARVTLKKLEISS
jgi:epoxyqueuosine reductase